MDVNGKDDPLAKSESFETPSAGGGVRLAPLDAPRGLRRVGPYDLIAALGSGGMGSVAIARRHGPAGFQKRVAVKLVHPHLADEKVTVAMFLDEARIAATINHKNVAQIHELGDDAGLYYLVMELVEGVHVGVLRRASGGKLPLGLAAFVISEAARGLHAAHEAKAPDGQPLGLVHRDVSPANILVGFDGSVKLTDFGVAKAEGKAVRTATGHVPGKASYMAPEQALGKVVDRRADVFALGVVLMELTTGVRAFGSGGGLDVFDRLIRNDRAKASELEPGFPSELEEIIERCMSRAKEDRYPTAAAVADALDAWRARSGNTATGETLAERMEELLGNARRERDARLLELEHQADASPPPAPGRAGPAPIAGDFTRPLVAPQPRRAWAPAISGLLLGALVTGGVGVWYTTSHTSAPAPSPVVPDLAPAPIDPPRGPTTTDGAAEGGAPSTNVRAEEPAVVALDPGPETAETPPLGTGHALPDETVARPERPRGRRTVPTTPTASPERREEAAPTATGYVSLLSTPSARVYHRGRLIGETPLYRHEVPAGTVRLELAPEGGPRRTVELDVEAGRTVSRRIDLTAP